MTLSLYAMANFLFLFPLVCSPLNRFQIDALFVHLIEGGHLAQSLDALDDEVRYIIDLLVGVEAADSESDRRMGELFAHSHRPKNVARLEAGARASRAARHGHVLDGHHHPLALDERERHVEIAGQAVLERSIEVDLVERRHEAPPHVLSLTKDARVLCGAFLAHDVRRFAETHDARHVERAGPDAPLVAPAVHLRHQAHPRSRAPDVESTDALGTVH